MCRYQLRDGEACHVSYSLLEAASLYQQVKHMIDWSTVERASIPVANNDSTDELPAAQQDEIYARRLQAEFDREARERVPVRPQVPANRAAPVVARPNLAAPVVAPTNLATGPPKRCGHHCGMTFTNRCCACSGKSPLISNFVFLFIHFCARSTTWTAWSSVCGLCGWAKKGKPSNA